MVPLSLNVPSVLNHISQQVIVDSCTSWLGIVYSLSSSNPSLPLSFLCCPPIVTCTIPSVVEVQWVDFDTKGGNVFLLNSPVKWRLTNVVFLTPPSRTRMSLNSGTVCSAFWDYFGNWWMVLRDGDWVWVVCGEWKWILVESQVCKKFVFKTVSVSKNFVLWSVEKILLSGEFEFLAWMAFFHNFDHFLVTKSTITKKILITQKKWKQLWNQEEKVH